MEHTCTDFKHAYHLETIKDLDKQSLPFDQIGQSFNRTITHIQ